MDENTLKLEARFAALEIAVADATKFAYLALKVSREEIAEIHKLAREQMAKEVFEGADPALSDLISGEIQEARENILMLIEESLGMISRPKT